MKLLLMVASIFCLATYLPSQNLQRQVFALSGGSFQDSTFHISSTIGEPVIGSVLLGDLYYSQGFQQGDLSVCSLSPSVTGVDQVSCPDSDDGWTTVQISGGQQPFSFLWNDGATLKDRNNLAPGSYFVTVTDALGCAGSAGVSIGAPDSFKIQIDSIHPASTGAMDGSIDVSVTGGTLPYTYSWSGPNGYTASTEDISQLELGVYNLVVTDDRGCDGMFEVEVEAVTRVYQPDWLGKVQVWPNPAQDQLHLSFPTEINGLVRLELYDILDRRLTDQLINPQRSQTDITLRGLAPGMLILHLHWKGETGSIRLIRQPAN